LEGKKNLSGVPIKQKTIEEMGARKPDESSLWGKRLKM